MPNPVATPAPLIAPGSWVEVHLHQILVHAIQANASDIHLEPSATGLRVRERLDGRLYDAPSPPADCCEGVISRLKILAQLDIAERRLPQDGQCRYQAPEIKNPIDLRVSTLPTTQGEKIVVRLLDSAQASLDVMQLGMRPHQLDCLLQHLEQPQGFILNTGPTGAGKTLTLYSCLQRLHADHVNISTVEDPCEINLPGINQVTVRDKIGLTFEHALRALMRQDPDVIMIGEIRDSMTAEMAIKAAQTGHMVLSSLHTNDAASTLTRLLYMGIPAFHINASLTLVCAQRLLRRLCQHCKRPVHTPLAHPSATPNEQWFRPVGCHLCLGGYSGRIGVFEVMAMTPEVQDAMLRQPNVQRFTQIIRAQGVASLRDNALMLAAEGWTSWEEALTQTPAP